MTWPNGCRRPTACPIRDSRGAEHNLALRLVVLSRPDEARPLAERAVRRREELAAVDARCAPALAESRMLLAILTQKEEP